MWLKVWISSGWSSINGQVLWWLTYKEDQMISIHLTGWSQTWITSGIGSREKIRSPWSWSWPGSSSGEIVDYGLRKIMQTKITIGIGIRRMIARSRCLDPGNRDLRSVIRDQNQMKCHQNQMIRDQNQMTCNPGQDDSWSWSRWSTILIDMILDPDPRSWTR